MAPHLVRVHTAYKDIRICSFHHTHTYTRARAHTHICALTPQTHARTLAHAHTHTHTHTHTHSQNSFHMEVFFKFNYVLTAVQLLCLGNKIPLSKAYLCLRKRRRHQMSGSGIGSRNSCPPRAQSLSGDTCARCSLCPYTSNHSAKRAPCPACQSCS